MFRPPDRDLVVNGEPNSKEYVFIYLIVPWSDSHLESNVFSYNSVSRKGTYE